MVGSPIYMAPEILKGCNYSIKADIWSMGVVLYEMLFGFCPYEDRSIASLINQIDNKQLIIPRHINPISKKAEELLKRMLIVDPEQRIDWNSLLAINLDEVVNKKFFIYRVNIDEIYVFPIKKVFVI
jgi:serine/threonine protein kinase